MINLRELATGKYRIAIDESYTPGEDKLWLWRIPCKGTDHIYIHGSDRLGAYSARSRSIRDRLAAMGKVHQRGDHEITVVFEPERIDEVRALLHAKRKRRMSEEQRQKSAERLARFQFSRTSGRSGERRIDL